ncbi:hypothetical protein PI124_g17493 [Phytophthora idaei]|nr:hypothetical protein PI126_g16768 [Phytophthora idaei]KAG3237522.1 hypothetical protein PI124_g17493 [Phytophthora idaei]
MALASKKRELAILDVGEVALFSVSHADLDPDARRIFKQRRRQVLEKLEKEENEAPSVTNEEQPTMESERVSLDLEIPRQHEAVVVDEKQPFLCTKFQTYIPQVLNEIVLQCSAGGTILYT